MARISKLISPPVFGEISDLTPDFRVQKMNSYIDQRSDGVI